MRLKKIGSMFVTTWDLSTSASHPGRQSFNDDPARLAYLSTLILKFP